MKRKLCFMALLCLLASAQAQDKQTGLIVGDVVPNFVLDNVINHPVQTIQLSDFKGKLLIIDFWATWCSPCLAAFPKTDSLNRKFKDKAQILPVTYQSKSEVERLFSRSKKLQPYSMPMVVSDKTLHSLFPNNELPHYVWISSEGKVIAITGSKDVNEHTIQKALDERKLFLQVKNTTNFLTIDREVPLLLQPIGIEEKNIQFQSLLTGYIENGKSIITVQQDEHVIRKITMLNSWPQALFAFAWGNENYSITNNRVSIEVADPSKMTSELEGQEFRDWLRTNSRTYELVLPPHLSKSVFEIMRTDMARFFPQYHAGLEKRKTRCLVLIRTSDKDKIKSQGGEPALNYDAFGTVMTNVKINRLTAQLNFYLQHLPTPVIDETAYTGEVDLNLQADFTDIPAFRKQLQKYDLDLIEKEIEIDILVIKDSNK